MTGRARQVLVLVLIGFLVLVMVVGIVLLVQSASAARDRLRFTTANIYVGLAPPAARADLRLALDGTDVLLAQEMRHRPSGAS